MAKAKRRVIYVDASGQPDNSNFTVSLYDPDINRTNILELKDIINSNEAEKYAVLNAILYVAKHNLKNTIILCDNLNISNNKKLNELATKTNTIVHWIPREINIVADKIAKLEPTLKDKDWYILKLFNDVVF